MGPPEATDGSSRFRPVPGLGCELRPSVRRSSAARRPVAGRSAGVDCGRQPALCQEATPDIPVTGPVVGEHFDSHWHVQVIIMAKPNVAKDPAPIRRTSRYRPMECIATILARTQFACESVKVTCGRSPNATYVHAGSGHFAQFATKANRQESTYTWVATRRLQVLDGTGTPGERLKGGAGTVAV